MVREVYFFTEMGYTAYSQAEARRYGYNNLMFPNDSKRTGRPCTVSAAGRGARSVHAIGRSLSWPSGCSTRSAWRP